MSFRHMLLVLLLVTGASPVCWNTISQIRMGTIEPIIDVTPSTTITTAVTATFTTAFTGPIPLNWALGVIGYDAYLTKYFSFNTTFNYLDRSGIAITVQPGDGSYLASIRIRYFVTQFNLTTTPRIQMVSGCFKCLSIHSGSGDRSESFTQNASMANSSQVTVNTYLRAWNFSNQIGTVDYIKVSSRISGSFYIHTVWTKQNISLSSVCISTITYDKSHDIPGNGVTSFQYQDYIDNSILASGITFDPIFDCDYVGFFGLSMIHHQRGKNRVFGVFTGSYSAIRTAFSYNQYFQEATLKSFYLGQLICNRALAEMYEPSSKSCVTNCSPLYANSSHVCVPCSTACVNCSPQNSTNCTACSHTTRNGSSCACITGYFDNGVSACELCSDYINNCTRCDSKNVCLQCNAGLFIVNGSCQCSNGTTRSYFVNNICVPFPGCIDPAGPLNAVYCRECNDTAKFQLVSISNLTCKCKTGYNNLVDNAVCSSICGDGLADSVGCDDNNTVNGDGCSSTCTVQNGWYCNVTPGSTVSKCRPIYNLTVTYLYAIRETGTNKAKVYFQVSPKGLNMTSDVLSTGKITTNASVSGDITGSYDPSTSRITATMQFTQSMQGLPFMFAFNFDKVVDFYGQASNMTAVTIGANQQLVLVQLSAMLKPSYYNLITVTVLAIGSAVVASLIGQKLAGLQLILGIQYSSLAFMSLSSPSGFMNNMRALLTSNGWSYLTPYDYDNMYKSPTKLIKFAYQVQFALNVNVTLGMAIVASIVFGILQLVYFFSYRRAYNQQKGQQPGPTQGKKQAKSRKKQQLKVFEVKQQGLAGEAMRNCRQNRNNYLNHFYFFMLAFLLQQSLFAFITQNMQTKMGDQQINQSLNVLVSYLAMLFFLGTLVFLLAQILLKRDKRVLIFNQTKLFKYPFLLIFSYVVATLGIGVSYTFSFAVYIALGLSALPLLVFIILRPYRKSDFTIDFIAAFACHLLPIAINCVYLVNQIMNLPQIMQFICTMAVVLVTIGVQVLVIIRLARTVTWSELWLIKKCKKQSKKKDKKMQELSPQDKNDVEMNMLVKDNILNETRMVDWQQRNMKEYDSINSQNEKQNMQETAHKPQFKEMLKQSIKEKHSVINKSDKTVQNDAQSDDDIEKNDQDKSEEEVDQLAIIRARLKKQIQSKRSAI